MEDENKVLDENSNTSEESEVLETTEDQSESTQSEESVDWESEAKKAKELAENYKVRAEKAERTAKTKVEVKPEPKVEAPSLKDYVALKNANIHEDDVDDVVEFAKFKKITLAEALKSSIMRSTLKEKEELRTTANATNTGKTRGGSSKLSGENLLEKASQTGEVPDSDEGMNSLLDARYKR